MNRHLDDAWYHLQRAADEAVAGVREALEPVERRLYDALGHEYPESPTRTERAKRYADRVADRLADANGRTDLKNKR